MQSATTKAFIGITDTENGNEAVSDPSLGFSFERKSSGNESWTTSESDLETNGGFLGFKQWIPLEEDDEDDEAVPV